MTRHPALSAVAILTLALGIGFSTAIFSVTERTLVRPLPFPDPERLVMVWETWAAGGTDRAWVSPPNFSDWQEQAATYLDLAAYEKGENLNLAGEGEPERVEGSIVSDSFFSVLGVNAFQGRTFLPGEGRREGIRLAVLAHGLWKRRYAADPKVVGRPIQINGREWTVVGIMPPRFGFPRTTEVWLLAFPAVWDLPRTTHFLETVGRLKPGVSQQQAQRALEAVASRLAAQHPESNAGWGVTLRPLHRELVGDLRPALLVLAGSVSLLLLIACANVANLMLARASVREPEIAVRMALGASRGRLVRQLLTESLLLAFLAGVLGLFLALIGLQTLDALTPPALPKPETAKLDAGLLAIAFIVSLATGILFGLLPAFQGSKPGRSGLGSIREKLTGTANRRSGRLWRWALVTVEMALSLTLVIGAGLLIRSFLRLSQVDPGFDPKGVLTFRLSLPSGRYPDQSRVAGFTLQLLERLGSLPGVEAAGVASSLAAADNVGGTSFEPEGDFTLERGEQLLANYVFVSSGYFAALHVPLLSGRDISARDRPDAPPVVVVNHSLARRFWPHGDAVGKRLKVGLGRSDWYEIVGIVGDVHEEGLTAKPRPTLYLSVLQGPNWTLAVALRGSVPPRALVASARQAVLSVDPQQPIFDIESYDQRLAGSIAHQRFSMLLLSLFAFLALLLASVGIYSVMSYFVAQRRHEIGIRMALGARPNQVSRLVAGQGLTIASVGVGFGLIASFAAGRLMSGLLFGVSAEDLVTFVTVPLFLLGVATVAVYLPARRAARVDPVLALKTE
jgi:putative ABC transport system permease protein